MIIKEFIDCNENFDPGWVNIYHNGKLIHKDIPNLTTVHGKEYTLQSITKIVPPNTILGDIRNYKIDSFSLGSGATVINNTGNITYMTPGLYDTNNFIPITFAPTPGINSQIYTADGTIRKVISGANGSIIASLNTSYNDPYFVNTNHYNTTIRYICKLDISEPVALNTGDTFNINEAFLYATDPNDINNYIPFSHVTFENRSVQKGDSFYIVWYLIL